MRSQEALLEVTANLALERRGAEARNAARLSILGVRVSAVTVEGALSIIEDWLEQKRQQYVCVTGAHGVIECRTDRMLRDIHDRAGLVVPDGMPLVFMAKRLGFSEAERVYGPDLMDRLTRRLAATGYRHFYYGGGVGLAERLSGTLQRRYPGLKVAGHYSPPFGPLSAEDDSRIVDLINDSGADIVWVGLSTPKQEYWMASHRARLRAPVLIGVGAAFDFLAGTKPQAPAWMQRAGLEWLYRLISEPRRLWKRYFRIVPLFAALASMQLLRRSMNRGYVK